MGSSVFKKELNTKQIANNNNAQNKSIIQTKLSTNNNVRMPNIHVLTEQHTVANKSSNININKCTGCKQTINTMTTKPLSNPTNFTKGGNNNSKNSSCLTSTSKPLVNNQVCKPTRINTLVIKPTLYNKEYESVTKRSVIYKTVIKAPVKIQ